MSKKRGIWAVGLPLSAMLDWCKRTADRYRKFADRIADQLPMVGRENQLNFERVMKTSDPLYVDFSGKRVELREFIKLLNIGDRIRVFCDDGVLLAEKISETQFALIQAQTMTELVH